MRIRKLGMSTTFTITTISKFLCCNSGFGVEISLELAKLTTISIIDYLFVTKQRSRHGRDRMSFITCVSAENFALWVSSQPYGKLIKKTAKHQQLSNSKTS